MLIHTNFAKTFGDYFSSRGHEFEHGEVVVRIFREDFRWAPLEASVHHKNCPGIELGRATSLLLATVPMPDSCAGDPSLPWLQIGPISFVTKAALVKGEDEVRAKLKEIEEEITLTALHLASYKLDKLKGEPSEDEDAQQYVRKSPIVP